MRITPATALTIFRLAAALCLAVPFLVLDRPDADFVAAALFAAASLTDFIDGYLARRTNSATEFGAMLDSIADKILMASSFIVVAAYSELRDYLVLPFALIMFREILIAGIRQHLGDRADALAVTWLAKWKTTLQMAATFALIAIEGFARDGSPNFLRAGDGALSPFDLFGVALIWIACFLTLLTGLDYFAKAAKLGWNGARSRE